MGLKFKQGEEVKLVSPTIQGKVLKSTIVGDSVQVLVEYPGSDGETHQRYFDEDELALVPQEAQAE